MTTTGRSYNSSSETATTHPHNSSSQSVVTETNFFKALSNVHNDQLATEASERDGNINMDTSEPSMFDFDPPSRTDSPFQSQYPSFAGAGDMPGWGSDMNFQPLSPPNSASIEPKSWDYPFPSYPTPSNILTNIQPNNARAQYGQVTPPDDENGNESFLDRQLREQQPDRPVLDSRPSDTSVGKKRTRTSATSPKEPSTKRTRKYGTRNSAKGTNNAFNKPEDIRRAKFLERNRVAASKCRQKKKEWTQSLEGRARDMQKNNSSMRMLVESLREEVIFLKSEMLKHTNCECNEIQNFLKNTANTHPPQLGGAIDKKTSETTFKKETSPIDEMFDTGLDSDGSEDRDIEDGSSPSSGHNTYNDSSPAAGGSIATETLKIASDESALEALLTSSLNREDSKGNIAIEVGA